ncbi:MAG: efflux RND transporter permease subunit [Candidatus Peregrinibacteria bacterium]
MSDSPQTTDNLYLEKLEFRPELRNSWLNFFVTKTRVVLLMIAMILIWGIWSFEQLPLELNPEVKIPFAVITVSVPGASPADMEDLVAKKIETAVSGVKGIKTLTSRSVNSFCNISVEFNANEDLTSSVRAVRDAVATVRNLPDDATDPVVLEASFDDQPVYTFSIAGPVDGFALREYADNMKDELEKIASIKEVQISGGDLKEFSVAYIPEKLSFYHLSTERVNQIIAALNHAVPSGVFHNEVLDIAFRTDGRFYDEKAIQMIPVGHNANGGMIFLQDIATVQEKARERTTIARFSSNGSIPQNAVSLGIIKRTGMSITDTVDAATAVIEEQKKILPPSIVIDNTIDTAKKIREQYTQLKHDFLLTLTLVMGILFLFVGLKEALVAGLAIPLVFCVAFGVMHLAGITMNFLSLFSLLLSLGLLVDDAIVVVSATKQYLRSGKFTPEEAVLLVLNDFKLVLTTTTFATTWAFLPLLLASGMMGQFIKAIPITVSVTLVASLLIALMINHPLAAVLERVRFTSRWWFVTLLFLFTGALISAMLKTWWAYAVGGIFILSALLLIIWYFRGGKAALQKANARVKEEWNNDDAIKAVLRNQGKSEARSFSERLIHGIIHLDAILPWYERTLKACMSTRKRRIITITGTTLLFFVTMLFPVVGLVRQEFFPPSDQELLAIVVEMPTGTGLNRSNEVISKVEEKLLPHTEIMNFSTSVGKSASLSRQTFGGSGSQSSVASITIRLKPKEERSITSYDLSDVLRKEVQNITGAESISVESQKSGPPSGAAFDARIAGDDLVTLEKIAKDLEAMVKEIPGTTETDISFKKTPPEHTLHLIPEKLEFHNTTALAVGGFLRTALSGVKITTVFVNDEEREVVATIDDPSLKSLEDIENLQFLNAKGEKVILKDVATIAQESAPASIDRIDQKRVINLTASVTGDISAPEVLKKFQDLMKSKNYVLPSGYKITYGGENEQNTESVYSILRAMIVAIALIIATIVIQFNSFRKAFIVIVTLPLSLIGVFIGMAIFHVTLSFPGLIGILALFGIVVKNAIILVDKIILNLKMKIPFQSAIIDAGKSRLEAIFITSVCTIVGIIPVTLSDEVWRALGSAIIFGLSVSSFLTLFIIPVLYAALASEEEQNGEAKF